MIGNVSANDFRPDFSPVRAMKQRAKISGKWFHVEQRQRRQTALVPPRIERRRLAFRRLEKLFHVEQFAANGKLMENFVATGFVLLKLQLPEIMPICALLQRMGILGAALAKTRKKSRFAPFSVHTR
jgi:hypothetical protein